MSGRKLAEAQISAGIRFVKEALDDAKPSGFKPPKDTEKFRPVYGDVQAPVLPKDMNYLQAAYAFIQLYQEDERYTTLTRDFPYYFINDFLLTVNSVLQRTFGQFIQSNADTDGNRAPNEWINIPTHYEDDVLQTQSAFYGSIVIQVWEGAILDIMPSGRITVRCKNKYKNAVEEMFDFLEREIENNKVMAGKCLSFDKLRIGLMAKPINPKINKTIVLNEATESILGTQVIPYLKKVSKKPLKALFVGSYGTGKTETAIRVGVEASERFGRTFIYLHNSDELETLFPYLRRYQHSVVFAEDVDQIAGGERNSDMNDLLNLLDGHEMKTLDVMFIFTTNNPDNIHPAMRRPGRIDIYLTFPFCSRESIVRIIDIYTQELPGADSLNLEDLANRFPADVPGAFVAEICKRSVQLAEVINEGIITNEAFITTIDMMQEQFAYMRKDAAKDQTIETAIGKLIHEGLKRAVPTFMKDIGAEEYAS